MNNMANAALSVIFKLLSIRQKEANETASRVAECKQVCI